MTKFLNISTDTTLGGNAPSDEIVSSQKAVKTYADTKQDVLTAGTDLSINTITSGKNKFDVVTMGTDMNVALYTDNYIARLDNNSGVIVPILPNTTYTVSTAADLTVFRIGTYPTIISKGESVRANAYVKQTNNNPITFTSAANDHYLYIQVNAALFSTAITTLQVEEGTTATTYTPYQDTPGTVITFTNDTGYTTKDVSNLTYYTPTSSLATVATSGSYNDLSDKPTIPTVNNATITITQGGVTKGSFTLNQASGDTIALDAGGGGGSVAIDNSTITKNVSDEIQAVAVIDQNTGIAKTWTGTQAEYDAIVTKDPETEYTITDDIGGPATVIAELAEGLNGKADVSTVAHVVTEFQAPTADNNYTWYRKYADGWVEQGGYYAYTTIDVNFQIVLPVSMESANYTIITTLRNNNTNAGFVNVDETSGVSATGFYCRIVNKASAGCSPLGVYWQVSGMAA